MPFCVWLVVECMQEGIGGLTYYQHGKGGAMENLRGRIELWLSILKEKRERKEDVAFIKGRLQGCADTLWNLGWDLTVNYAEYTYQLRERE